MYGRAQTIHFHVMFNIFSAHEPFIFHKHEIVTSNETKKEREQARAVQGNECERRELMLGHIL